MNSLQIKRIEKETRVYGVKIAIFAIASLLSLVMASGCASADSENIYVQCGYDGVFLSGMTCSTYSDATIDMDRVERVEIIEGAFDDYGSLRIVLPTGGVISIESSHGCPGLGGIPAQDITSYFAATGIHRVRAIATDDPNCSTSVGATVTLRITYKACRGNNTLVCENPGECQTGPGQCAMVNGEEVCVYPTSKDSCDADGNSCTYDVCKSNDGGLTANCSIGPNVCGGMVPCNRLADDPSTPNDETQSCTFCHLALVANRVIDYMIKIASTLALLALIVASLFYIISNGNPERRNAARGYVANIIKGYAVVFLAWLIVDFILSAWGFMNPIRGDWNVICTAFSLFK